ncbi:hypothetical protein BKA83DRAFT_211053 [Pisolithus microcarpus]|nr:hypothetical protein BKA83DRAFT_211053 [Pisolithus microcarpus]
MQLYSFCTAWTGCIMMRLWFTCRAVILVSKSFNFCTTSDHVRSYAVANDRLNRSRKHLIYCFCSLAFSEDHEPRWDPTIRRMRVGGIQYDITVCINESHGTRVSEACLKVRGWNISEGRGTCHIKGFLEGLTETARMSFPDRSLPICGSTKGLAKTVRASLVLS